MKQPKPDRLVVTLGMPMTVHSADERTKLISFEEPVQLTTGRLFVTWRVSPRLVVAREDSQVTAANKLLVVHGQQGARALQELRMEDHFDAIVSVVEELAFSQSAQNGIDSIGDHIVSADWWQTLSLPNRETSRHL